MRCFVRGMLGSALVLATFLGGWAIGDAGNHTGTPKISREIKNAQRYADWCGGYVQVVRQDIIVQNCDQ